MKKQYKHIATKMKVEAEPFKPKLADGQADGYYYIEGHRNGIKGKVAIDENCMIVHHKDCKFVFTKKWFFENYKEVKQDDYNN